MASTGKARNSAGEPEAGVEETTSLTDTALGFRLGTTTREQLDCYVPRLARELSRLLGKDLGADEDTGVQQLLRKAREMVDLTARPTVDTPTFGTFFYLRDLANLSRRLLWVYATRNELGAP
ncbi:hypothetical protein [Streptomyces lavenduligriseus]|uniref:Uncharacterized protein n=1 Tax=Streptomyces lavenduligriseus TaxID=67315 RepID=A0ABT0NXJ9_9ACTN|nr:hypothetical protein [Streptomyces lavenduligriseus]MCL3996192.1 hypothetical protein [Streptomyces lavenduligriseus]